MPLCGSRSFPIVSWCNHWIVRVLWIWKAHPSRLHQQDFNTLRIRAVLSLLLLFTLCTLTRVAHEFSHSSGSKRFSQWENKPWSNNQDNLSSEAENGDYWSNNHSEVCSEMGGSYWPPVAFLLTWRQPTNCTNLGTLASVDTCMLPQWHLQQQHQPCSVVPSWVLLRKNVEHDKVPSKLAHDENGTHNIVVSEDLIWSLIAFSWCPEYICNRHKFVLSDAEVATFND